MNSKRRSVNMNNTSCLSKHKLTIFLLYDNIWIYLQPGDEIKYVVYFLPFRTIEAIDLTARSREIT